MLDKFNFHFGLILMGLAYCWSKPQLPTDCNFQSHYHCESSRSASIQRPTRWMAHASPAKCRSNM